MAAMLLFIFALQHPLFAGSSLSDKSPFLPPGHGAKAKAPTKPTVQPQGQISRELEFRGIVKMAGVYQFSIFNKKDQKGYWLKENKATESGIVVSNYDEGSSSIIVNMNGRSERLTLLTPTDSPLAVPQAKTPVAKPRTPNLPPQLRNQNQPAKTTRRVIPRRRVVPPKKN